jgi:ribosome modulation factor
MIIARVRPETILASGETEPTEQQIEAYDTGRAAYGAGDDSTTCPYDARSEEGVLWLRGWTLARRDDLYGPVR